MPAGAYGNQNLYTDNDINRSGLFLDQVISPDKKGSKFAGAPSLAARVQEASRSNSLVN